MRLRPTIAVALSLALAAATVSADKKDKPARAGHEETVARYPVPDGLRGFDGTIGGNVVSVQDHMRGFVLKVNKIVHTNARSTASAPKSAIGSEVEITPTVTKDANGRWVPDERELNYIKSLEKGDTIQIDVVNTDANHLRIGDLTKAEKQQADREKKKD